MNNKFIEEIARTFKTSNTTIHNWKVKDKWAERIEKLNERE